MIWPSFVSNRNQAWLLFKDAKTWSCRPSNLMVITDPFAAYCFDQAIGVWGNSIEGQMDSQEGKTADETNRLRHGVLMRFLDGDEAPSKGRFADPAAMFR